MHRPVPPVALSARERIHGPMHRHLHAQRHDYGAAYYLRLLEKENRSEQQHEDIVRWLQATAPDALNTLVDWSAKVGESLFDILSLASLRSYASGKDIVLQDETPSGGIYIVLMGTCTEYVRQDRFSNVEQQATPSQVPWRTLSSGQTFGFHALYYHFDTHYVTLRSNGHIERNSIGISTISNAHLLYFSPSCLFLKLLVPTERIYPYDASTFEFVKKTYLFQALQMPFLEFLVGQMQSSYAVRKGEYLYTAGQPTAMYLIASGEFRIYTIEEVVAFPRDPNDGDREIVSRKVELQILKAHDIAGVSEVCYYHQRTFSSYCVASAASMVFELPMHATLSIIKPSTSTFQALAEYFKHQRDWYKLRRFTALNRHNQATEFPLTSAMQRKSPLRCPRCGQVGHLSDSARCRQQDSSPHQVLHQRELTRLSRLRALEERGPSLPTVYHIPSSVKVESRLERFLHRLDAALGFNRPHNQLARQAN